LALGGTTSGGTFKSSGTGVITIAPNLSITANGAKTLTLGGSNTGANTFSGSIGNSGAGATAITKADGGRWILSNTANTYTGITTVSAGILEVTKLDDGGNNSSIGASGAGAANLVFNNGGILRYTGSGDSTNRAFTYNSTTNSTGWTFDASGTGALEFTNTASPTFTGTAGQIRFLTLTGTNTNDNILAATLVNNGAGAVNVTKTGLGKWVLTSDNTYTGTTFVNYGTLEMKNVVGGTGRTRTLGGLNFNLGDGTFISNNAGFATGTLSTTFTNAGVRAAGATGNIVSTGGTNGTDNIINTTGAAGFIDKGVYFGGSEFAARNALNGYVRALAYGSDASAAAVDTITASNHVKLTSTPGSQAAITLLSLNLAGSGVSWTTTSGNLNVPGIIKSGGGSQSIISGGNLTTTSNAELVIRTDTSSDSLLISSHLTQGSGILTKSGAGTLTLTGTNTYTGQTHVNAGILSINANVRLGAQATGATLNLKGGTLQATSTFGLYNGSPGTNNRAVVLTNQNGFDVTGSNTLTVAGVVSGAGGGFNKTGTGTLALTGTNTYTGATNINQGTLAVNGTGAINSSAVTINGGTFRYNSSVAYNGSLTFTSGTVGGTNLTGSLNDLTIGTNQTLSPGNSPGTATTGDQTWAGGGTYLWEINNATATAGTDPGWDLLSGTGTLDITASNLSTFTIMVTSLGLDNLAGSAVNFDDSQNYNWMIADFSATISTFAQNAFSIDTTWFLNAYTGTFGIARGETVGGDNSQIYLTYTPVPEPRAALLGGIGLLLLFRRRRN
jgi:fibronectin-binding autotransporter adhesin